MAFPYNEPFSSKQARQAEQRIEAVRSGICIAMRLITKGRPDLALKMLDHAIHFTTPRKEKK